MKRQLIAVVDRARADLLEAVVALERDEIEVTLEKFLNVAASLQEHAAELRGVEELRGS